MHGVDTALQSLLIWQYKVLVQRHINVVSRGHRSSLLILRGNGDEERTKHELGCVVESALVIIQARHFSLLHQIVLYEADGELELD